MRREEHTSGRAGVPAAVSDDLAAVGALLPRVTIAAFGAVAILALLRGPHGSETWDKAMFLIAVVATVLLGVQFVRSPPARVAGAPLSLVATGCLVVGIAGVEHSALASTYWEGFGLAVAIGTVVLAVFLWDLLERAQASGTATTALTVGVVALAIGDLTSLVRTLSNFADPGNNVYVLNELLAPSAGRVPDATFVPQYVTLYGWVLVPFRHLLSARDLAQLAMLFMTCLALLSVVIAVRIAYRAMASPSIWVAVGLVVPLTCVTVKHGVTPHSSIASALQELPIRMFPAMLLSLLGLEELARLRAGRVRAWHLAALGVLAGLIVWNSQDFGVAVTVAYFLLLLAALPAVVFGRSLALWAGGLFVGGAIYPLACLVGGNPIQPRYVGLVSRAFASGFGSESIQIPGPVLIVLPLLLSSAAVGWSLLWRTRRRPEPLSEPFDRSVLTLTLVSTWGIAGFAYYLNRSYASGQMQILLMPCGVCLAALLSIARESRASARDGSPSGPARALTYALLPAAVLASLGFASTLQSPNPVRSLRDVSSSNPGYGFDGTVIPFDTVRRARQFARQNGGTLGYFGSSGNYVHLATGVEAVQLFDDPAQAVLSSAIRKEGCRFLRAHRTDWLLVSPTDQTGYGPPNLCGLYRRTSAPGIPRRLLYARIG